MPPATAPVPTKVKMLRSETRPSRLIRHEAMPSPDIPKMPSVMDAEAKVVNIRGQRYRMRAHVPSPREGAAMLG